MEKNTALREITAHRDEIASMEYKQQKAVVAAKLAGASWAEIGTALDLTKQRAHQKYAEAVASAERIAKWKEENPEEAAAAEASGRAKAQKDLAEIRANAEAEYARKKAAEDHAQHVEATTIFLDGTAPAKPTKRTPKPVRDLLEATETYTEFRPVHQLPEQQPEVAQPGTGKGPHLCPNCKSSNHKTTNFQEVAFFEFCTPTKYDTPAATAYMRKHTGK